MIEAMVAAVRLTDELNFGVSVGLVQNDVSISGLKPFGNDDTVNLKGPLRLRTPLPLSATSFSFAAIDEAGQSQTVASISCRAEDKVKVLASPHILVLDNREASIQVGVSTSHCNLNNYNTRCCYDRVGYIVSFSTRHRNHTRR